MTVVKKNPTLSLLKYTQFKYFYMQQILKGKVINIIIYSKANFKFVKELTNLKFVSLLRL